MGDRSNLGRKEQEIKKKSKPFKALERRMARGTGIILELQGGRPDDYVEVVKQCEKEISLKEWEFPLWRSERQEEGGC